MENRKYKVLIAEDEYWTREKLCRMIQWEKYALELMEPAEDGEEALSRIEQETPDILITDINMPHLNGVELQKIIHQRYPDVVTFVISGYDDFEFVKNSFLSGAVNYLLKPVNKIDLVNALSKGLELISEKQTRQLELQKASSLIMDREFSRLLEKQDMPFTPNITMNSRIDFAGAGVLLIKIHNMHTLVSQYQYDQYLLSWSVKKRLREIAGDEKGMYVFNHIYRSNEFLIITEREEQKMASLAGKIAANFGKMAQSPVTVVISEPSYSLESINHAYTQTISALMTRKFRRENEILFCRERAGMEATRIETRLGEGQIQELRGLLRKGRLGDAKKYIRDIVGLGQTEVPWTYLEVRQSVRKILNLILEIYAEHMCAEDAVAMENLTDFADKVVEQLDGGYLCEVLGDVIDFTGSIRQDKVQDTTRGLVKQAAAYIDEHYFEELTLSSLAEQFHVESSYFSRLFRQETGENVMLYIARTRIEQAKRYMEDEHKSLTEIAFLTGYDDYTYFNRVFRKTTGKSPRDYRQEVLGK